MGTIMQPPWGGLARLADRATVSGLLAHKLGAYGAFRLGELGLDVPPVLHYEERAAAVNMLTVGPLLRRIRDVVDGPLVLFKGPEVSRLYPGAARRFGDVDILCPRADEVQEALVAAGFEPSPLPSEQAIPGHHHLQILRWPSIPLRIEIHSRPNWPLWAGRAPVDELIAARVPGHFVEGVDTLRPAHHGLVLAAHSWREDPLETLRDLVDVAAVSAGTPVDELRAVANAWGIGRAWLQTERAIDSLLGDGPRPFPLRTWARHLGEVRERSVVENHLQRHLSPFASRPPVAATAATLRSLAEDLRPEPGETWGAKARRSAIAIRHARLPTTTRERGRGRERRLVPPSTERP